jgi:hypothetical protein
VEAFVGKADMLIALGAKVDRFNGFGELLLEGVVDIRVLAPFAEVLRVLADGFTDLCGGCGGRKEWLGARVCCKGGGHDGAKVAVRASSSVGGDGGGVLFQLIAQGSE